MAAICDPLFSKTIQTFAGHSSLTVTMNRFGHLFPSDDHKAVLDVISGELMEGGGVKN